MMEVATDCSIRWLIRRDMDEVLAIEKASFSTEWSEPWSEEEFLCCLRQRYCIGMVKEHNRKVVGFVVYELHKTFFSLSNIAVHPDHRGVGFGLHMLERLKNKLEIQGRTRIEAVVSERNIGAQVWMQRQGFKCIRTLRNWYDVGHDAYQFVFSLRMAGR